MTNLFDSIRAKRDTSIDSELHSRLRAKAAKGAPNPTTKSRFRPNTQFAPADPGARFGTKRETRKGPFSGE